MKYVYVGRDQAEPFGEYGGFGAWYDTLTFDRAILAAWARRLDPSLTGSDDAVIARIAQPPELGGGFVAGGQRMCLSNLPGGRTEPARAADVPCPPGSGGVVGEQVQEISAEELRQQLEEQKRREAAELTRSAETVEVTGSVQRAGTQTMRSVTIRSGMTGTTHPTFGKEPGGEPMSNLTVEVGGQSARTDGQGRFTVRGQAPGVVTGVVRDRVGQMQEVVLVVIGNASAVTGIGGTFRIPLHTSELRGRVVDPLGRAVGRATVEIEADPASRSGRFDGRFDIVLAPGASLLPDSSGINPSGIYYGVPYSVRSSAYVAASTTTNSAGIFSVKVPTGSYTVKVRAAGFGERRQGGVSVAIGATRDVGDVMLILPLTATPVEVERLHEGGGVPAPSVPGEEDGIPKTESGTPDTVVASVPWYKSTWFWVGVATITVGGTGYLIWRQRKGR